MVAFSRATSGLMSGSDITGHWQPADSSGHRAWLRATGEATMLAGDSGSRLDYMAMAGEQGMTSSDGGSNGDAISSHDKLGNLTAAPPADGVDWFTPVPILQRSGGLSWRCHQSVATASCTRCTARERVFFFLGPAVLTSSKHALLSLMDVGLYTSLYAGWKSFPFAADQP